MSIEAIIAIALWCGTLSGNFIGTEKQDKCREHLINCYAESSSIKECFLKEKLK